MKKYILVISFICSLLFLCSCSKTVEEEKNNFGYSSLAIQIPTIDGKNCFIESTFIENDEIYISVGEYEEGEELATSSGIYTFSSNGDYVREYHYDSLMYPECIVDGKFIFLSSNNEIVYIDKTSGEIVNAVPVEIQSAYDSISPCDDGFVILCDGAIQKYSGSGILEATVYDNWLHGYVYRDNFFEEDGRFYVVVQRDEYIYYEIDFENNVVNQIATNSDLGVDYSKCHRQYIYKDEGLYKISFNNMELIPIADWNNVNKIPPKYIGSDSYYFLNDQNFVEIYNYVGGEAELILYSYDPEIDYSGATRITVGGYNIQFDYTLAWAVYLFNSTHDDYRIVLDDYTSRFSGGITAGDFSDNRLELIQYFNEGNAPDVYYGNDFDYRQFYSAGMVSDLSGYLGDISDTLYPSIYNAMNDDGKIYSIFPGFIFDGYWGTSEDFNGNYDIPYSELVSLANGKSIYGNQYAYNIASSILEYNIYEDYSNGEFLTEEEITNIINFAIDNGISYNSNIPVEIPSFSDVAEGDYLLSITGFGDIDYFASSEREANSSFLYIGYPSINGSIHLIEPVSQLAMSSDTAYPDVCWEFMSLIYSDEVQTNVIGSQIAPVTINSVNKLTEYKMNPEAIPEDDYLRESFICFPAVEEWIIDDFYRLYDSLDTIYAYDWGIYSIIQEEVITYDTQGKTAEEIAASIKSRIEIYIAENY